VLNGYTSPISSRNFGVTGNKLDMYLYQRLRRGYSVKKDKPLDSNHDFKDLFKIKHDLKETCFSPYKIGFNYQILKNMKQH